MEQGLAGFSLTSSRRTAAIGHQIRFPPAIGAPNPNEQAPKDRHARLPPWISRSWSGCKKTARLTFAHATAGGG